MPTIPHRLFYPNCIISNPDVILLFLSKDGLVARSAARRRIAGAITTSAATRVHRNAWRALSFILKTPNKIVYTLHTFTSFPSCFKNSYLRNEMAQIGIVYFRCFACDPYALYGRWMCSSGCSGMSIHTLVWINDNPYFVNCQ